MSQQDVAGESVCSRQYIMEIQKGCRNPSLEFSRAMAEALGYPFPEFAKIFTEIRDRLQEVDSASMAAESSGAAEYLKNQRKAGKAVRASGKKKP